MANIKNMGIAIGRLTKDPVVFPNKDGSKKVMITLAVQDNYKAADGTRGTQFIALEAFVSNKNTGKSVYDYMHKGDKVGVEYTVRTNNYKDSKTGEDVYSQVLFIQSADLSFETKASQATRGTDAPAAAGAVEDDAPFAE